MNDFKYDPSLKVGLKPGELLHVGERKLEKIRIRVIDFDSKHLEERELESIEECRNYKDKDTVSWINVDGLHNIESMTILRKDFGISSLVFEDVINTHQRPKFEDYGKYIFIIAKMINYNIETRTISFEHISFVLGENYVLSFQERFGDFFEPVRERIRNSIGRIRRKKVDYLNYALLDVLVDNYFVVADKFNTNLNELEEELMADPSPETLKQMYIVKRELLKFSRNIRPMREVTNNFYKMESQLIEASNTNYLRDLYDHTVDLNESVDMDRELISGMIDTYISITGNKLNEIMKILTIMASIFIPLTFMAGIYGMNFDNMPELHEKWGYHLTLLIMFLIGLIMVIYFRRKKWF